MLYYKVCLELPDWLDASWNIIHYIYYLFLGVENSDLYNDIAILELKEEVDVNVYTPACLASAAEEHTFDAAGKSFTLAGWGNFQHNEHRGDPNYAHIKMESPDVPHEAQVTGLECIKKVKLGNRPRPDTICIDPSTGRDGAQVHMVPINYLISNHIIPGRQWRTPDLQGG